MDGGIWTVCYIPGQPWNNAMGIASAFWENRATKWTLNSSSSAGILTVALKLGNELIYSSFFLLHVYQNTRMAIYIKSKKKERKYEDLHVSPSNPSSHTKIHLSQISKKDLWKSTTD